MGYAVTISIPELLAIGEDITGNVLARTFVENIGIVMALALNADTCIAFAHTSDTNALSSIPMLACP